MPGLGLSLRLGRNRGASGASNDPDVDALLAQAITDGATPMSGDNITYSNTLITSLKSAGVWDKLDLFYVFATNGDEEFARYNWKAPSTFKLTEVGAGALTFTSNEGFTGDGTNYLDTGWNIANDSSNFTQNAHSFGIYSRTDESSRRDMGYASGTNLFLSLRSGVLMEYRASQTATTNAGNGNSLGFFHVNRDASNSTNLFQNSSTIGTGAVASVSLVGANLTILGGGGLESTKQLSIAFAGGDLSSEASDFYNAVNTYMTSLGKNV